MTKDPCPANDKISYVKVEGSSVIGMIISSAEYSQHLEFGTTKMKPRPFMHPSLRKNVEKIEKIFIQEGVITK